MILKKTSDPDENIKSVKLDRKTLRKKKKKKC